MSQPNQYLMVDLCVVPEGVCFRVYYMDKVGREREVFMSNPIYKTEDVVAEAAIEYLKREHPNSQFKFFC